MKTMLKAFKAGETTHRNGVDSIKKHQYQHNESRVQFDSGFFKKNKQVWQPANM